MKSIFLFFALIHYALADSWTLVVPGAKEKCINAEVTIPGRKYAFYFSVQSGGGFDIDFQVKGPGGDILNGKQKQQGDYVFTANTVGEYNFCFNNAWSAFAERVIDLDITSEDNHGTYLPPDTSHFDSHANDRIQDITPITNSIHRIGDQLGKLSRLQSYYKTREHRNMATVDSTKSSQFWWAIWRILALSLTNMTLVWAIRSLFKTTRGGRV